MKRFIFFICFVMHACAYAFSWQDLWLTKDGAAQKEMQAKDYKAAEALFSDPEWKGVAAYRAGNYAKAQSYFQSIKTERAYYNAGNAFAKAHQYKEAIAAYKEALRLNPKNKNALENKNLIEKLLKNQQDKHGEGNKKNNDGSQKEPQNTAKNQGSSSDKEQNQGQSDAKNQPQNKDKDSQKADKNAQKQTEKKPKNAHKKASEVQAQSIADREKQQTKEQWLRLIPDNPGGLLREKFLRDYQRRQRGESN